MDIQSHIEDLRHRLRESPASRDQIARATAGVISPSWVNKFAAGRMNNPRADSLVALDQALSQVDTPPTQAAA